MPIYEYRCSSCNHELEAIQKFADAPMRVCPSCGKETLVKLISAAGFQLKGSGWYATDFKGSGKPADKRAAGNGTDGEAKAGANGDASGESKSDSKSTAKSDATPDTATAAKAESKPESKPDSKPVASGSAAPGAN